MRKLLFALGLILAAATVQATELPYTQDSSPTSVYVAGNTYGAFGTSFTPLSSTDLVAMRCAPTPRGNTWTGYALSAYLEAAFTAAPNTVTAGSDLITGIPNEWIYVPVRRVVGRRTIYLNMRNAADVTLGASGWVETYEIRLR